MKKTIWRAPVAGAISMMALGAGMAAAADDKEELPTIAQKTEGFERIDGLFPLYKDPEDGSLLMEINAEQLGEEFIAFTYTENGVLEAGTFRGAYRDNRVVRFDKHYGDLELSEVNTSYYFDPESPLARAADANISPAILGSLDIIARTGGGEDKAERYLIAADPVFKSEMLSPIAPAPDPLAGPFSFQVGGLSSGKTKYDDVRGYPENVDLVVDYVFDNPMPLNGGSSAVTDARSVTLKVQHSLIAMPEEGYEPRLDDYRVGYFFDQVTDLTSFDAAPYRDLVNRWRLVKEDPEAAVSDPVEPITWWIENTTPYGIRDAIKEGVLAWNEAFEAAGFSNAMEVKVQPDDADWDAGDIRYNVLRWTSSPMPPFGGYGPSFTNPRTGEILGADIMLELSYLKSFTNLNETFETAGLPLEAAAAAGHPAASETDARLCLAGRGLRDKLAFGLSALQAQGASEEEQAEMVRQSIVSLILHEVGHTLGLNHNMKGTIVYGPEEVHDKTVTQGAPSNSVMDYHATNIAPLGVEQGDYEHTRVGAYDKWAIEFGYSPDVSDEETRRQLLARSSDPMLAFGNDADDMRSPANGIDPRVMIFDQSSDPVAYGIDRAKLVRATLPKLLSTYEGEDSYQKLLGQYLTATGQQFRMMWVISRQVGGVHVERTAPGQDDGRVPYTPVPEEQQKKAMRALADYLFAADAFEAPEDLIRHLQQQRRGYDFFYNTEDPKLHERALSMQMQIVGQLLHPNTLARMTNSGLYGNGYTAAEMVQDLNDAVFGNDLAGMPNTYRRNLQVAYTQKLVGIAYGMGYDPVAQAAALAGIDNIKARFGFVPDFMLPLETRAHRAAIRHELGWLD